MVFRTLNADEIECRVSTAKENGVSLLLYKDARCDMRILDETVGQYGWQRDHKDIKGVVYCGVGLRDNNEWIWKWDAGAESYTEKEKGEASDSFKRACFNWGIGRELYTAPFIWVKDAKMEERNGKLVCKDNFSVKDIEYTDGKITKLTIINQKQETVYAMGVPKSTEECITLPEAKVMVELAEKAGWVDAKNEILKKYRVERMSQITKKQYVEFVKEVSQ